MRKSIFTLFLSLLWLVAFGQSVQEIADQKLKAFVASSEVPGLSVSVSQKGELVFSKGYGFADVGRQIPVDPSKTRFRIGSVSKTLTAAGLAWLYQGGKIDLDIPIQKYVPNWPKKEYEITLRQLGGHLAGIRHYRGNEFLSDVHYPSVSDGLSIFMNDPLINKPGTAYSYSSYGWNLIAAAMETASAGGMFLQTTDFLEFMQSNVFIPLDMTNTSPEQVDEGIPNLTRFYQMKEGEVVLAPFVDNSYKWAGGGFVGTTEDLCKFGQAHMMCGFLSQAVLDEWMTSQKTADGKETNYGIGWSTYKRPSGLTFYGHSGGSVGGITFFMIHKETQTVFAITGNMDPLNYNGLQFELMEMFVKGK
jgi:CubicO group peptidase (beta-lactamase class C family)